MLIFSGASWKGSWCLLGPRWLQDLPQTPPKTDFSWFWQLFGSQLGSILGGFWDPSWCQNLKKIDLNMYWKIDWFFNWLFIGFWSILGPKTLPKPFKPIFSNFAGSLLEGVLVPLGAKMAPRPPPDLSQDRFFLILDPNLVDFGAQLGGFWSPSWWILDPILVDFGGLGYYYYYYFFLLTLVLGLGIHS